MSAKLKLAIVLVVAALAIVLVSVIILKLSDNATDAAGNGGNANEPRAPGAPRGLTATVSNEGVTLTWSSPSDPGSGIYGYNVYRSTTTEFDDTPTAVAYERAYTDKTLVSDTYYYEVKAYNAMGEGFPSDVAEALVDWDVIAEKTLRNGDYLFYDGHETDMYGFTVVGLRLDFFNVTEEGFDANVSGPAGQRTYHYSWDATIGAQGSLGTLVGNTTLDTIYGTKSVGAYQTQTLDSVGRTWTVTFYVGRNVPVVYQIKEHCDYRDTWITLNIKETNIMWIRLCNAVP